MPPDKPDERLLIETLCGQIGEVIDASNATPGSIKGRIRNGSALAGEPDGASGSTGIVIASP